MLATLKKLSNVLSAIRERLHSWASLFVLSPLAFKSAAIYMDVLAETVCKVLLKLASVHAPVRANKNSDAMCLAMLERSHMTLAI
eukprot:CAMPEP_0172830084 /NCGR_PEP_ID=MMETSP1075-20121228/21989_1 /TAXON_ID=2916 /ORGANISM="Ceratium fusus, Strain PA161109" /LENGTH=84 /DNA_ID=CAMNT_0013672317 /DNA_START=529 /DNA_END=783 /DNA_ORIENTATION=+